MALQFILGNSGSGKTEYMYQRIVKEATENPFSNYLVIVPEQFTLQTQKKLVELSYKKAIMNIDVLSFKRLAYRVFDELGIEQIQVLDETGKNLVLRKVAQEHEKELTVLRSNMNRVGYINEVKSLLSELVQYNITTEELKKFMESNELSQTLSAKLEDVTVLYDAYNEFMKNRYTTNEELLNLLQEVAPKSEILRNSTLVFDEFTGFTPIQNRLLRTLFPMTKDIFVALTMDGKEDFYKSKGMQELFDMPKKTISSLEKIAEQTGVLVADPVIFTASDSKNRRFVKSEELSHMEANLFRRTYTRWRNKPEQIQISSVKNPFQELIVTARQINDLVQNQGFRYQEIAVVTGSTQTYESYVEEVFEKYHIPFYFDATKDIVFHPFIEFLKATLEVLQKDFDRDSVFRFLRCGFLDMEAEQIDILENYVLATGIHGYRMWSQRFTRNSRRKLYDFTQLEELRQQIMQVLSPVRAVYSDQNATVKDEITVLCNMMCELSVEQKLWDKEAMLETQDRFVEAKEYGQIYTIVMQIFEKYVSLLGDEVMSTDDFIEILEAGLDAAKVATIPPGKDCVIIGDIERTRLSNIRVLFFLGVNEGIIPKKVEQGGIISQYEREHLKEMNLELAPGAREQSFMQRYYLYLNTTKPSEKLYISFSRLDMSGQALLPSYFIQTMKRLYMDLEEVFIDEAEEVLNISTKEAAFAYLLYGKQDEAWYELAKYFMNDEVWHDKLEQLLQARYMHYEDLPISRAVAEAIYGNTIKGSVTRLENYARCAYSHFLKYGIGLREREEAGLMKVDVGNLYHDALDKYSNKLVQMNLSWDKMKAEEQITLSASAFREAIQEYGVLDYDDSFATKHELERMQKVFEQTVWALTEQIRAGVLKPEAFEISFDEQENMKSLSYDLGQNRHIKLQGRIDRIDSLKEDGKVYVKVIDYKSGSTKYDLMKIYQGTQLQLVVYLNAAMEMEHQKHESAQMVPTGLFYYHIDDPQIELEGEFDQEAYQKAVLKALRPNGLVNEQEEVYRTMDLDFEGESLAIPIKTKKDGSVSSVCNVASEEDFARLQEYAMTKTIQIGQEIFDGKISVNPLAQNKSDTVGTSCSYCPYMGICGIQSKIPGYETRVEKKLSKEEIYSKMDTENAIRRSRD